MGWSSAGHIFDPVARALIDTGVDGPTKRKVLGDLIKRLQDGDWDTEDESLEQFLDDPDVVAAFADHGIRMQVDPEAELAAARAEIDELRGRVAELEHQLATRGT
ncbi:hypothetical protein B4N89_27470 [Embleya scabrispora]|uniref:Uncharacterized protein n=1 Tax=Embleya scabrispora TaxID=159449 RepID=A0A1T3P4Z8_9ACTN|nr:hypothetical protein [Embleya scabrispora]OPC84168.1 hypothetical protein B4N89_27470 [Embleya scabrispora]